MTMTTPPIKPALLVLASLAAGLLAVAGCSKGRSVGSASTSDTFEPPAPQPVPARALSHADRAFDPLNSDERFFANDPSQNADPIVRSPEAVPLTSAPAGKAGEEMNLDGMESLSQVTFAAQGSDFDPSISRDGQVLVYASTQHRPTADIYMKLVNGRTVTQLTADPAQDVMPAISPDGHRIAFASNRTGSWDIFVMSSSGGQAVQVTSDPSQELRPSWSPDGKRLVYCRLGETSGRWEMWVADVDQPMVSEFIGYGLFPSWCPMAGTAEGGRDKILFQRSRERGDRAFSVWTVDYKPGDTSSPTEVISGTKAAAINPAWSPDGTRIVFATVPYSGSDATNPPMQPHSTDLCMVGIDGSGRVNLTSGRSVNLMPTWGPDGRIYFVSDRGGIDNIWSIGTDKAIVAATGNPTPGTRDLAHRGTPAGKDGRTSGDGHKEEVAGVNEHP